MAEGSVTKALSLASRELEATDLRLRELGDQLAALSVSEHYFVFY